MKESVFFSQIVLSPLSHKAFLFPLHVSCMFLVRSVLNHIKHLAEHGKNTTKGKMQELEADSENEKTQEVSEKLGLFLGVSRNVLNCVIKTMARINSAYREILALSCTIVPQHCLSTLGKLEISQMVLLGFFFNPFEGFLLKDS